MKYAENPDDGSIQKSIEGLLIAGLCFLMAWPLYSQYSSYKDMLRKSAEADRLEVLRQKELNRGFYSIQGIGKYKDKRFSRIVVTHQGTLWNIAAHSEIYSDGMLWPLIFEANRETIVDPNLIYPNTELWIPKNASKQEKMEARKQARKVGAKSKPITL